MILGKAGTRTIQLGLAELVPSRLLIQGNSGSGKSYTLRKVLELTAPHIQQIVIDIDDEFHTLRSHFDYVLASNDEGDCPAEPRTAKMLARKLLELRVSAIIGLHELEARAREDFVKLFLESLMSAPKSLWGQRLIAIDEAHIFCPERGKGSASSTGAVIDLMTRGRKRGFCGILATQRVSKLNKDATTQANNMLIGRCVDVDMKRAGEELGMIKADWQKLKRLKPGEFYAFGPALTNEIERVKIGKTKTKHPEIGQAVEVAPPSRKVKGLLAKLADLPEKARQDVKDLSEAKREITALRQKVTKLERGQPVVVADHAPCKAKYLDLETILENTQGELTTERKENDVEVEKMVNVMNAVDDLQELLHAAKPVKKEPRKIVTRPAKLGKVTTRPTFSVEAEPIEKLNAAQQRVMDSLAWWKAAGIDEPSRRQVAFAAGYTESGHFNNTTGSLKSGGLLVYPGGGLIRMTEAGESTAQGPDTPPTSEKLQRLVKGKLSVPQGKLFDELLERHPEDMHRSELAELCGYTESGHFNNTLGSLKSLGIVKYSGPGRACAADFLFF